MVEVARWFYWVSIFSVVIVGLAFLLIIVSTIGALCESFLEKYVDARIEKRLKESEQEE